ncbi:efflux RND transporter periplasmic adaptor subunit [soil metagenome]
MNQLYKPFAGILIILFSISACKTKAKHTDKPRETPPVIVDVLIASAQPVSNVIEANGNVLANEYVELHPEVSGRLTYLKVPEGSYIAQGTMLAKINDADLRAQVGKSKVQLDLAIKTVERYKVLLDVSGINQSDYDLAVNAVNGYRADIGYTQSLIDKTVIKAPFSGTAGLRQVSPGAYVTPASVIATLQQTTQVKIDFTLPDVYGNTIKSGSVIDVELDGKKSKATVIAIEPGANTDTRNIKVRAVLQGGTVNPGAFVKVYIDEGKNRTSIKVPTNAIIPNDKNNQLVVVKNGIANFINVQTGNREANSIEILSGLNEGDSVVVTGVLFAKPKGKLKVRGVKNIDQLIVADSTDNK